MSDRQLPYPLPGRWDPSGPFRNPGGTNPLPRPTNLPVTVWFGGRMPVAFTASGAADVDFQYTWASPTYDLYPWLRGISPDSENSLISGATPIWAGPSSMLRFQVTSTATGGLAGARLEGLRVSYQEFGHISQVTQVESIDMPQDITAQFTSNQAASVVTVAPKPVRYYRVEVLFEILSNFGAPGTGNGPLAIQGAMY